MLECSSKGDKRFSAFYAKVNVWGKYDSIENHYQLCKRFGNEVPKTWRDAKGRQPTYIELKGKVFDTKYLTYWYKLLWLKYLDENPHLVEYAKQFDDFSDMFKGKNTINCQADVIRQYVKEGRESIINECKELIDLLKKARDE
ncbi:DarT1-associated NADAR antitoxin family protein [Geobacillus thermodenitrificans]|uniref:DarT1-associated NADAR antitoxin family protein n=1 Tax=Geobacillus thermodenitrificans TaxID=33940 RepID=UPI003D2533EE